ncbi:hypothetical protein HYFRA_00004395 [Hymenoscyphus fraxineus]|uniref:ribonuclease Z n=1 Tax=Hymenoscyphus fraxineus TaxID=746836 RepID=A0A9N9KX84_9HELO|nr:hypothetical protein HYFRA_00004395 [Hymenoscyphus fraxineus]
MLNSSFFIGIRQQHSRTHWLDVKFFPAPHGCRHISFTQGPSASSKFPAHILYTSKSQYQHHRSNALRRTTHNGTSISLRERIADRISRSVPGELTRTICASPPKPLYPTIMKCWLQIFSTPTADTPGTSIILHFDQKRYLIGNVGEGTQRATVQRKVGLQKVGNIFLTGVVGWDTVGGLLGMILTVADVVSARNETIAQLDGKKKKAPAEKAWMSIHGGKNLNHLLATARCFIFRKGMPLRATEFRSRDETQRKNWDPAYEDDCIKVWDMIIDPENGSARKRSHDEFSDTVPEASSDSTLNAEEKADRDERYDRLRQSVVHDMFDSDWRMDALVQKKLSEVALPATIFIRKDGKIQKYTGPMPGSGVEWSDVDVLVRNPWPGAMIDELPPTEPSPSSICYIIKGHPQRGKFDAPAALKLGVKKGPSFRDLTMGKSVTTQDGKVVTPEMVMGPTRESSGFAIIELPTTAYVGPLIDRPEWSSNEVMNEVKAAIWILGPGVTEDTRLQEFMKKQKGMKHIVSSKDCCPNYLAMESPATSAIKLSLIDSDRFPVPKFKNTVEQPLEGPKPFEAARPGLIFDIEPRFQERDDQVVPLLNTIKVVEEARNNKEVMDLAKIAQTQIRAEDYQNKLDERQRDIPSKDAEIVTLGTGSAVPSKYRNVSATLLRVPGYGTYLFDCGENTLGQLKRVFGDELPEVLRDLKAIWISHLHADHHLGTAAVIKAWAAETSKDDLTKNNRLHVVAHDSMTKWLREYSEVEDFGYSRVSTMMISQPKQRFHSFNHTFAPEEVKELGITYIQAVAVQHCNGAAAVVFNFPNGFKVAYSGDCRPSKDFIRIGQNATLLIHEATFDDELQSDAYAKKHCTTSDALNVGREMNARRILLTHFSQRYQKIPVMDNGERDQVAIVAFDYMRVKIGDFAKMEAFKPALMKLYENEITSLEENGHN